MDEMRITSKLMRSVIAKIIKKSVKNRFGCDIKLVLHDFYISYDETNATIHLDANAQMDKANLEAIFKEADLL